MATTIRSSRRGRGLKPADVALTLDDLRDVRLMRLAWYFLSACESGLAGVRKPPEAPERDQSAD
jgi:hypothetical protein